MSHNAVGINGYSNTVVMAGNCITNLPWALYCYGSFGGNQVLMESNTIVNSIFGGVLITAMAYKGLDLGGGAFGSRGGNVFLQSPLASSNYLADVLFTNFAGVCNANVFALHNQWSNPTNKESVIYDKLDNPALGRLITDDLLIKALFLNSSGYPVLSWNERGAGEQYTIETCTNLNAGGWMNAPGSWPVTNATLNDKVWTNPVAKAGNAFYRIRSLVP